MKYLAIGAICFPLFYFVFGFAIGMVLLILMFLAHQLGMSMKTKNVAIFGAFLIALRVVSAFFGEHTTFIILLGAGGLYVAYLILEWFEKEEKHKKRKDRYR
jgi:hypothetical protein